MGDASKYPAHSLGDSLVTLSETEEGKLRHQEAPVSIHLNHSACLLGFHQNVGLKFGYLKMKIYIPRSDKAPNSQVLDNQF